MQEVNPNVTRIKTNGHSILDGDIQRILDIVNTGNIKETNELFLTVPVRKLDGLCPPWASPFYPDMCDFYDRIVERAVQFQFPELEEETIPFEGMYYHVRIEGFVCIVLNSYKEDGSCWKLS